MARARRSGRTARSAWVSVEWCNSQNVHLIDAFVDLDKGSFVNDKKEGFGRHIWPDGAEYEGEYKANRRNGKGTYHFRDGSKYMGEWLNNKRNGQGCEINPDGSIFHNGEWKNDKPAIPNGAIEKIMFKPWVG